MFNTPLPTVNELPSTRKLLRSTVIAILVAAGLLVTVVMPSEYAIDPTGLGRALGADPDGRIEDHPCPRGFGGYSATSTSPFSSGSGAAGCASPTCCETRCSASGDTYLCSEDQSNHRHAQAW